ncbi:hypothetical protein [Arcicella aurantiaca]|nr:hypothetical protein [Arcicella aurantiaca]
MNKKTKLKDIIVCCEIRFDNGSAANWKHSDFCSFSDAIMKDTGVNISANTLKRIFGKITVDNDYQPQQATIEALAKYGRNIVLETPIQSENVYLKRYSSKAIVLIIGLFVMSLCMIYYVKKYKKITGIIRLSNIEGQLPQTTFFDLILPNTQDSLFVDFGDKSLLQSVNPTLKKIAHTYLFPGVFEVKLRTAEKTIANTKVLVESNKWIGLGFHNQQDVPNRHYEFTAFKTGKDSLFHIPNQQLFTLGLDTLKPLYVRLCNYASTGYKSDNFVFETTFKNKVKPNGVYCNSTQFQITGLESKIRFKFTNHGCSYRVLNFVSEQTLDGSKMNLSAFAIDLSNWTTIKMVNKNKHLELFVNGKSIYQGKYQQPLGEIKGVFLEFAENGFVKSCSLKSLDEKILFLF